MPDRFVGRYLPGPVGPRQVVLARVATSRRSGTKYPGIDPEANRFSPPLANGNDDLGTPPALRTYNVLSQPRVLTDLTMLTHRERHSMTIRRLLRGAVGGLLPMAGPCSRSWRAMRRKTQLLQVETPDIVTTDSKAQSVAGAQSFYTAGVGDFSRFIGGDRCWKLPAGSQPHRRSPRRRVDLGTHGHGNSLDNRSINPKTRFRSDTWVQVGNTYTRLVRAAPRLIAQFPPATGGPRAARAAARHGGLYSWLITAEDYCNGIPMWDGKSEEQPAHGDLFRRIS